MKAQRNKTLLLTDEERELYLSRCITADCIDKGGPATDSIIWGDTFDTMGKLPKGFADLMIVDPPYNLNKTFGESKFHRMDDDDYARYTERWIQMSLPLLKRTASVYVCCDWQSSVVIAPILKKYFILRNRITWQREKGRGAAANWKNCMEDIWYLTVSDDYTFNVDAVKQRRRVIATYRDKGVPKDWEETADGNFRDTYPSNFWDDISVPYWSMAENTPHPTQKPEKLMAKLILASSNEGDVVFDPFLGSGTTAVTAKKLKRHFVGVELDGEYCAMAQKRLEMAEEDKSIQGYTDGVFWERNTVKEQKKYKK